MSSRVELHASSATQASQSSTYRALPLADVGLGLRILADLLDAGMSVHRAMASLGDLAPDSWRAVLPAIEDAVRQGSSLAASLELVSNAFPSIAIGVVRAGEGGSGLAASVRRAAEITEDAAATRAAVLGALAYPALLCVASGVSVGVLTLVVLPRFATILSGLGQQLPRSTMMVLSAAAWVRASVVPGIVTVAAGLALWRLWTSNQVGRRQWAEFVLQLPLIGAIRFAAATSRGCAALAALLQSGLPIAAALPLAGRATGDAALVIRFAAARTMLTRGSSVAFALGETNAVTSIAVRLAKAGEESGRLAGMLDHAARLERERATRLTRVCVRTLEPILILFFGGVVATVAGALLQAVYSVRPT